MKKILFIDKNMDVGGIQTSLINILTELKDDYDISLLLFSDNGTMKSRIPEGIRIIKTTPLLETIGTPFSELKKSGTIEQRLFKLFSYVWTKVFDNSLPIKIACSSLKVAETYDVAVAFHHETGNKSMLGGFLYCLVKRISAKRKLAWIHYDINQVGCDLDYCKSLYEKVDNVVCVSQSTADAFRNAINDPKVCVDFCYNLISLQKIQKMAFYEENVYGDDANKLKVFTACRLNPEKGIPRAIQAIAPILREQENVVWYIAGDGKERENIKDTITQQKIEGKIVLLGELLNPYPYMREANLLFLPSLHEAAPMTIDEAKCLGTPVLSTETVSAREMITDQMAGFVCENSEDGIRTMFSDLVTHPEKIETVRRYLNKHPVSNSDRVSKLKFLFGE